jgi:hypothetical protein
LRSKDTFTSDHHSAPPRRRSGSTPGDVERKRDGANSTSNQGGNKAGSILNRGNPTLGNAQKLVSYILYILDFVGQFVDQGVIERPGHAAEARKSEKPASARHAMNYVDEFRVLLECRLRKGPLNDPVILQAPHQESFPQTWRLAHRPAFPKNPRRRAQPAHPGVSPA